MKDVITLTIDRWEVDGFYYFYSVKGINSAEIPGGSTKTDGNSITLQLTRSQWDVHRPMLHSEGTSVFLGKLFEEEKRKLEREEFNKSVAKALDAIDRKFLEG